MAAQGTPELFRLTLDHTRYSPAPLRVVAEDLVLELHHGAAFVAVAHERPTVLVLVGEGTFTFAPPVRSEQRQVQLFAGSPVLTGSFESAYVRLHPAAFDSHVVPATLRETSVPEGLLHRAEAVFREEVGRSFAFDPAGPGEPSLSALPPPGDFLVEVRTSRRGRLAYARVSSYPEDILLIDRERGRQIASYPSREHMATTGFEYGDEQGLPYEALGYDVEVTLDPPRAFLAGRARLCVRALQALETVSLRLDRGATVSEVRSAEQGLHQFLHQRASDTLLVRLLPPLAANRQISLEVTYAGSIRPQELSQAIARSEGSGFSSAESPTPGSETTVLYSNRVYWFPQSPVRNHTPATLRVTLPSGYSALATGIPDVPTRRREETGPQTFLFRTEKPVRYLSLLVGKLEPVEREPPGKASPVSFRIVASARRAARARSLASEVADILRFYTNLLGDTPYPRFTLALVETTSPAGHSPAYLSILGESPGWNPKTAGDDPAYLGEEPIFFVAHEIAHQWWGQAVGWRNYREQWLSEGLAQYSATLYIRQARGEKAFARVLTWMRRWAMDFVGQGPISLGVRAGEVTGCAPCFAAIVYNRGACVLHMLRGLMGDEKFFRGLRLYYERWKFCRAGTDDLRRALEESSGLNLSGFFEQWVRDDGKPELRWSAKLVSDGGRQRLRLHLQQLGEAFELPLQISIDYHDRASTAQVVRLWLPEQEFLFDLAGRLRRVRLNEDLWALAQLRERR